MKVVIAGGSGFLGRALTSALLARGHAVVILTRDVREQSSHLRYVTWSPGHELPPREFGGWPAEIDGADAVINLTGASLDGGRWTRKRKEVLRQSRIESGRALVDAMRQASRKPSVFVSGSACGYYGTPDDTILDESFPPGDDFLSSLCVDWEANATPASALGVRVVLLRSGLSLAPDGGVLKKMMLPFKFFVGGPVASGRQYISWIHLDDWTGIVTWALGDATVSGAINATAPTPVTSREFTKSIGRAMRRPSWLPVPAFALRILFGEMADVVLSRGQRVVPKRALAMGYTFKYPDVDSALDAVIGKATRRPGL